VEGCNGLRVLPPHRAPGFEEEEVVAGDGLRGRGLQHRTTHDRGRDRDGDSGRDTAAHTAHHRSAGSGTLSVAGTHSGLRGDVPTS